MSASILAIMADAFSNCTSAVGCGVKTHRLTIVAKLRSLVLPEARKRTDTGVWTAEAVSGNGCRLPRTCFAHERSHGCNACKLAMLATAQIALHPCQHGRSTLFYFPSMLVYTRYRSHKSIGLQQMANTHAKQVRRSMRLQPCQKKPGARTEELTGSEERR